MACYCIYFWCCVQNLIGKTFTIFLNDRILQLRPFPNVIPALEWGRTNEDVMRKAYIMAVTSNHSHLKVTQTGLHLHPSYPFVGASPDGIVECSYCGLGLLEIKCPYSK